MNTTMSLLPLLIYFMDETYQNETQCTLIIENTLKHTATVQDSQVYY